MKPETSTATIIDQDRLATWEEIRLATAETPGRIFESCYTMGTHCDIDFEQGGTIRYPAQDFEFFAYLSELEAGDAN